MKKVRARVKKVLTSAATAGDSCRLIKEPIRNAPTIPIMEPTAAPISVFSDARLILRSNRIMQTAMMAPTPAEIHGSPLTGLRTYPEATRIPVKINRIMTTSACMMTES